MSSKSSGGLLVYLLADIAREKSVLKRFEKDPRKVLDDYGISKKTRDALKTGDGRKVGEILLGEAAQIRERLEEPGSMHAYAGNPLSLKSISPTSTSLPGGPVAVKVTGSGILTGATVSFQNPANQVSGSGVEVQDDGTVLTAQVQFTATGVYDVTVANPGTPPPQTATLAQAFTVTKS